MNLGSVGQIARRVFTQPQPEAVLSQSASSEAPTLLPAPVARARNLDVLDLCAATFAAQGGPVRCWRCRTLVFTSSNWAFIFTEIRSADSLPRWRGLAHDNDWVESRIRPIALGRQNWLFAGSLRGSVRNSVFEALLRGYEPVLVNRSA